MRTIGAFLTVFLASTAFAAPVEVENVRMWPAPDHTRVVLDISAPVEHTLFTLKNPNRIVIDLRNVKVPQPVPRPDPQDSFLSNIRTAVRNQSDFRVVLDLKRAARPKSFLIRPNKKYGHRLVIDLLESSDGQRLANKEKQIQARGASDLREVVIAIDAGHGGEDPGAVGRKGTREKDVVLAIARRLESLVQAEPGMRAVMVRSGDYYISLRQRIEIARQNKADFLVSIHADAFKNNRARGSSVYVLSRRGASSEAARWLADQENSADLIGGVSLDDKDDLLASVLLDLSQTATLSASSDAASMVLTQLRKVGNMHKHSVQKAGFLVLKSPDVPSILIETAFISNAKEERKLRDSSHQEALARAILRGIRGYFERNALPGTLLAARKHVIARGDTLSKIASRYGVPLDRLVKANGLERNKIDKIDVGQVIRIPQLHEG